MIIFVEYIYSPSPRSPVGIPALVTRDPLNGLSHSYLRTGLQPIRSQTAILYSWIVTSMYADFLAGLSLPLIATASLCCIVQLSSRRTLNFAHKRLETVAGSFWIKVIPALKLRSGCDKSYCQRRKSTTSDTAERDRQSPIQQFWQPKTTSSGHN